MKKLVLGLVTALFFLGCSSNDDSFSNIEPQLVKGKSLQQLKLNDQFEKTHTLTADTKKVIFAFSKDMGHLGNDFFSAQDEHYLENNHAVYVADISQVPSLIRSMFVLPGLKDYKHTVLLISDNTDSVRYKPKNNSEKIMIVDVDNFIITNISFEDTKEGLQKSLEL